MVNTIVAVLLFIALVITVFLSAYTLIFCKSSKRLYFVVMTAAVFLFVLGYLLEVTAESVDGAFSAIKVMYLGSAFISPLFLMFVADYCEYNIKKPRWLVPLLAVPSLIVCLLWTTNLHHLFYVSYSFNLSSPIHHLEIVRGPLYYLNHFFALLCTGVAVAFLIQRMRSWDQSYRPQIILLIVGALTPLLANILLLLNLSFFELNYTPLSLALMNVVFFINIIRYDIFDIVPQASEVVLMSINEGYLLVDATMRFLNANPATYSIFPDLRTLKKGYEISTLPSWPKELMDLGVAGNVHFSLNDGQEHFSASVNPLTNNSRLTGWVILLQDISESVQLMQRLESAAYTDGLTGIYNRRHFMELAQPLREKAFREQQSMYIIIFDLDHFKNVNDTYGHQAGDEVLKMFATIVKNTIRPYDLFARYGGEEFILSLTGLSETAVHQIAERIRRAVMTTPYILGGTSISITVSLGVAACIEKNSLEDTIKSADDALYTAKNSGRNQVVVAK